MPNRLLLLVAGICAAVMIATPFPQPQIYPVTAWIGADPGVTVAVDTNSLHFGRLPPETVSVQKQLVLRNPGNHSATLHLMARGNISQLLSFPDTVQIGPAETRSLAVTLAAENAQSGFYTGELVVWPQ